MNDWVKTFDANEAAIKADQDAQIANVAAATAAKAAQQAADEARSSKGDSSG